MQTNIAKRIMNGNKITAGELVLGWVIKFCRADRAVRT
jgi:hypothetical protein